MKRRDLRRAGVFTCLLGVAVVGVAVGVGNWVVGLAGGWIELVGIWGLVELFRRKWMDRWIRLGIGSVLVLNFVLTIWAMVLFIHEISNKIECEKDRDDSCYIDSILQVLFEGGYVSSSITLLYFNGYILITFYETWKELVSLISQR